VRRQGWREGETREKRVGERERERERKREIIGMKC
jgi:hypothetical protein